MPPDGSPPSRSPSAALVKAARARVRELTPDGLREAQRAGAVVVDLREREEVVQSGTIPGAIHVPRGVLEFAADPESPVHQPPLDPARHTVLFCAVGGRSALAVLTLEALGYRDVVHLAGGIEAWRAEGLPTRAWPEPPAVSAGQAAHGPDEPLQHRDEHESGGQGE